MKGERNPLTLIRKKKLQFLYRYVQGENPFKIVADLWPEVRDSQKYVREILASPNFQAALKYLAEYDMTPMNLAYRLMNIAEKAEKDSDKIIAIRTASVIMGHHHSLGRPKTLKTQKLNLKKMGEGDLQVKLEQLAKQIAGDTSGHQKQPS